MIVTYSIGTNVYGLQWFKAEHDRYSCTLHLNRSSCKTGHNFSRCYTSDHIGTKDKIYWEKLVETHEAHMPSGPSELFCSIFLNIYLLLDLTKLTLLRRGIITDGGSDLQELPLLFVTHFVHRRDGHSSLFNLVVSLSATIVKYTPVTLITRWFILKSVPVALRFKVKVIHARDWLLWWTC